jgi:hypothetical protein
MIRTAIPLSGSLAVSSWRWPLLILPFVAVITGCQPLPREESPHPAPSDPGTSEAAAVQGSLPASRARHFATLLPSGEVLLAGGDVSGTGDPSSSTDVYSVTSGLGRASGWMTQFRVAFTGTLLPSGKILVVGGTPHYTSLEAPTTAELFDPVTDEWSPTGSLTHERYEHTATLLPSGKVLVVGAPRRPQPAELYDPATGTWTLTGQPLLARSQHSATLLPSGQVLITGGYNNTYLGSAELYDPATGTWSMTGSMARPRSQHSAILLLSGKVLVIGGFTPTFQEFASTELYDPATGTWSMTGAMAQPRTAHTATLLPSGSVLVTGGQSNGRNLTSVEWYDPDRGTWATVAPLSVSRRYHSATLLPSGEVLIAGGFTDDPPTGGFYLLHSSTETYGLAPVVRPLSMVTAEDQPLSLSLEAASNPGGTSAMTVVQKPTRGSLSGSAPSFSYIPLPNFHGSDVFTYKATVGALESVPATVTITITPVDDAPTARSLAVTTRQGAEVSITLDAKDEENSPLTYIVVDGPTHGQLQGVAPVLAYIPQKPGYGADVFTYKVHDGALESEVATVSIRVTPSEEDTSCTAAPAGAMTTGGMLLALLALSSTTRGRTARRGHPQK